MGIGEGQHRSAARDVLQTVDPEPDGCALPLLGLRRPVIGHGKILPVQIPGASALVIEILGIVVPGDICGFIHDVPRRLGAHRLSVDVDDDPQRARIHRPPQRQRHPGRAGFRHVPVRVQPLLSDRDRPRVGRGRVGDREDQGVSVPVDAVGRCDVGHKIVGCDREPDRALHRGIARGRRPLVDHIAAGRKIGERIDAVAGSDGKALRSSVGHGDREGYARHRDAVLVDLFDFDFRRLVRECVRNAQRHAAVGVQDLAVLSGRDRDDRALRDPLLVYGFDKVEIAVPVLVGGVQALQHSLPGRRVQLGRHAPVLVHGVEHARDRGVRDLRIIRCHIARRQRRGGAQAGRRKPTAVCGVRAVRGIRAGVPVVGDVQRHRVDPEVFPVPIVQDVDLILVLPLRER